MIVTVDTMVLIWGVKRVASAGQDEMIGRAARFLEVLRQRNTRVVLTAQVVAEYVCGFPLDQQAEQFRVIKEEFAVFPFDLRAAVLAAKLFHNKEVIEQIKAEFGVSRHIVKADLNIIATAVAAGASTLYSNDKKFRTAAQGTIIVQQIPDCPPEERQAEMFSAS